MNGSHRLEKRARMLVSRMTQAKDGLVAQLSGRPFTGVVDLGWWADHIHDQYGAAELRRMDLVQQGDLRAKLYAYVNGTVNRFGHPVKTQEVPGA